MFGGDGQEPFYVAWVVELFEVYVVRIVPDQLEFYQSAQEAEEMIGAEDFLVLKFSNFHAIEQVFIINIPEMAWDIRAQFEV